MRLIVDSLIALMLVAILGTIVLHYRQQQQEFEQIRIVHHALARLHEQTIYHRALEQVREARARHARTVNEAVDFPEFVAPTWFGDDLPLNVLAPIRQPWLDVAAPADSGDHPPDPVIKHPDQAGFWYNPNRGVFRARVPAQFSEERTLELYNRVNATYLLELPYDDDPQRQPRPHPLTPDADHRRVKSTKPTHPLDPHLDAITVALPAALSLSSSAGYGRLGHSTEAEEQSASDAHRPAEPTADGTDQAVNESRTSQRPDLQSSRPTLDDRPRLDANTP